MDQLVAEFKGDDRPRKPQESAGSRKKRELFDTVCFIHKLTPKQLAELAPEDVRTMLKDLEPALIIELPTLGKAMREYASRNQ